MTGMLHTFYPSAIRILIAGVLFGVLFPVLSGEWSDPLAWINAITIGLLGSLFLIYVELIYDNPLNRKMKFIRRVVLKTILYSTYVILLIPLVIITTRSLASGKGFFEYMETDFVDQYINSGEYFILITYTLLLSGAIVFTHQISMKMGPGILWKLITGKYHRAQEEERILLFLDLVDSTGLAERLGPKEYSRFLNNFFYDITPAITATGGEIYRYIGDEIILSWPYRQGVKNAKCIRTFFLARQEIRKRREFYLTNFGIVPDFTAGLHAGKVVVGEIGDVKSQIVFNGRVIMETEKIQKQCKLSNVNFISSAQLLDKIKMPSIYSLSPIQDGQHISMAAIKELTF